MKPLTKSEVQFVKDTKFTPTVFQCDEYERTTLKDYEEACRVAKEQYNFELSDFLAKNNNDDSDGISLEYVATYLFYCFFTKEELEKLTDQEATDFLKDYRYYGGFRRWDGGNLTYVNEAIDVCNGERVFYLTEEGDVWNTEKETFENNDYNDYFKETTLLSEPILD